MSEAIRNWIEQARKRLDAGEFSSGDLDKLDAATKAGTQKVLYLVSKSTSMRSAIGAWSLYDPSQSPEPELPSDEAPYKSVIEAVGDGWRIVQFPRPELHPYSEQDNAYLGYEFILEKFE